MPRDFTLDNDIIASNNGGLEVRFPGRGQQTGGRRVTAFAAQWLVDGSVPARCRRELAWPFRQAVGVSLPSAPERSERQEPSSSSPGRGLPRLSGWRRSRPPEFSSPRSGKAPTSDDDRPARLRAALSRAVSPARYAAAMVLVAFTALFATPAQAQTPAVDELDGVVALELAERPRVAVDADVVQRRRLAPHDRAPTEMGLDVGVLLPNILNRILLVCEAGPIRSLS